MNNPQQGRGDYTGSAPLSLIVPATAGSRRLDQILAELLPQHSRNRLQTWVRDGRVHIDGVVETEPKRKLYGGEALLIWDALDTQVTSEQPEDIPLNIVYEDEALLVINKPAGLVVHPGSGNWSGTLLNALLHHYPQAESIPRAGIVHRLDKDTSGLMVVAKTLEAQTDLVRQLQARTVKRIYRALAIGVVDRDGVVDQPIGRHPVQRVKMAVVSEKRGGKPAVTHYRVIEIFGKCTLVECSLETGRTHQIRVHMAHIGHPLLGDPVYGRNLPGMPPFPRQALHALRLGLIHPVSGLPMQWQVPLPDDMRQLLDGLRYG